MQTLIKNLNKFLKIEKLKTIDPFLKFIELSKFGAENIDADNIPKEGYILKKKERKHYTDSCVCNLLTCGLINCCCNWQSRWFILQDEMICYLENFTSKIGKAVKYFFIIFL